MNILNKSLLTISLIAGSLGMASAAPKLIEMTADNLKLTLMVGDDNRVYQLGFGDAEKAVAIPAKAPAREMEFLPAFGNGVITEPALQATHTDGNTSTVLRYLSHASETVGPDVEQTVISLGDPAYRFFADIYVKCYKSSGMMEMWTVYRHDERGGRVTLYRYASASPIVKANSYWLTQLNGRYKHEATLTEERLSPGLKTLDSKLGVRAHQYRIPSFILSCGAPASEREGETFAASLRWSGSFSLVFDLDWNNALHVISGINPLGAHYQLERGEIFTTPSILWAYSKDGKGETSRRFHRWASAYGVREASKVRPVLLNNWEATHCDFDEERLCSLFDGASEVGAEFFLLDDGWFGNGEFSRDDDRHGLGDWQVSAKKLPNGLTHLAKQAEKRKIGFGIWLEPEMVSPMSELYSQHPDWIIGQPKREPILGRHQEILDLTRPEVQHFVRKVFSQTLGENPQIAYVKWDCNRFVTQPGSSYLPAARQSHLLIDYNRALYGLMDHFAKRYPNVMAMLCAGGGGRVDYGAMPYFHSFWPSDNTDPIDRVKIQWGFGHFFPASTISAHVTRMGKRHLKLAIDVALSGMYGIDLALDNATPSEKAMLKKSIEIYSNSLRELVMNGDLYRLVSPYESPLAALSYVAPQKDKAVVYLYQVNDGKVDTVKPEGLDPDAVYTLSEINVADPASNRFSQASMTGREWMEKGVANPLSSRFESAILQFTKKS